MWREYGPGKFLTVVDSYIYNAGVPDRETGSVDEHGWYGYYDGGLLELSREQAEQDGTPLTDEEVSDLTLLCGAIVYEDFYGFVDVNYFESKDKLEAAWKEIEAEEEKA